MANIPYGRGVRKVSERILQDGRALIYTEEDAGKIDFSEIPDGAIKINKDQGTVELKLTGQSNWIPANLNNDGTVCIAKDNLIGVETFTITSTDCGNNEFRYLNSEGQARRMPKTPEGGYVFELEKGSYQKVRSHLEVVIDDTLHRDAASGGLIELTEKRFELREALMPDMKITAKYSRLVKIGNPMPRIFIGQDRPTSAEIGDIWIDTSSKAQDTGEMSPDERKALISFDNIVGKPTDLAGYGITDDLAYNGHVHSYKDILDFPVTMPANGGHADYATQADDAKHALNADNANDANKAKTADYALDALKAATAVDAQKAGYAAKAGYAESTGFVEKAQNAEYAAKAGYAYTAQIAEEAKKIKKAEEAKSADYAKEAGNSKFADTANYAVSAGSTLTATSAAKADSAKECTGNAATADYAVKAGKANYATNAGTADNAKNAEYAAKTSYATEAGNANYAKSANTASTAGVADSAKVCTGNAKTADYATSTNSAKVADSAKTCTGNAATATNANHAARADRATVATSADKCTGNSATASKADHATKADRATVADTADNANKLQGRTTGLGANQIPYLMSNGKISANTLCAHKHRYSDIDGGVFAQGMIMMWYGNANTVPAGWRICDGQHGTPDLRDRFIVGAGGSYGKGATGGAATRKIAQNQIPEHRHTFFAAGSTDSDGHDGIHSAVQTISDGIRGVGITNGVYDESSPIGNAAGNGGRKNTKTGERAGSAYLNGTNGSGINSNGGVSSNGAVNGQQALDIRPPYYALFYIMYTG